ncbi:hypothetical protein PAERUG_P40_Scotland_4_VIM_2_09_12_04103 [Pseudomonas aeruginosa]|nr:hypothetical protein PAERUG_P40_Scotland_4_VIM_2_09_12_04103 [Pseudomonas aeruginosa]
MGKGVCLRYDSLPIHRGGEGTHHLPAQRWNLPQGGGVIGDHAVQHRLISAHQQSVVSAGPLNRHSQVWIGHQPQRSPGEAASLLRTTEGKDLKPAAIILGQELERFFAYSRHAWKVAVGIQFRCAQLKPREKAPVEDWGTLARRQIEIGVGNAVKPGKGNARTRANKTISQGVNGYYLTVGRPGNFALSKRRQTGDFAVWLIVIHGQRLHH